MRPEQTWRVFRCRRRALPQNVMCPGKPSGFSRGVLVLFERPVYTGCLHEELRPKYSRNDWHCRKDLFAAGILEGWVTKMLIQALICVRLLIN